MAKKTAEVQESPKTELAVVDKNLPATYEDMQADANIGRGQMGVEDTSLPYLAILQSLSPQVKKGEMQLEDAEEGMLFNTVTQELIDGEEGVDFIPCFFQKAWVEWQPRSTGGGFVKSDSTPDRLNTCKQDELGFDILPNGNILMPTYYYYGLMVREDGATEPIIVSMTRTALKKGRKLNNMIQSKRIAGPNGLFNPPMFAQKFHLSTMMEKKPKGDFYNWNITPRGLVEEKDVYAEAKELAKAVEKGLVKAGVPNTEMAEEDLADVKGGEGPF